MAKRISHKLEQMILSMYQELQSGPKIARQLRISPNTVYRTLDRHDIEHRQSDAYERARRIPDTEHADIIARYNAGASLIELAKDFDCSPWTIGQLLRRNGINPRTRGGSFAEVDDETVSRMVELYEKDGWSQSAIAKKFSLTQVNVSRILRRNGIKPRRRVAIQERHGNWKGGRVVMGNGYIGIMLSEEDPMHSMADRGGYVLDHRLVMARALGRPLTDKETVHHINGDRTDNRIENLQLRQGKHGKGKVFQCANCGSYHIVSVELAESTED